MLGLRRLACGIGAGIEHQQAPRADLLAEEPRQGVTPAPAGFLLCREHRGALEAAAEEEDQQRHRDDVVELAGNLAVADRQAVQERNRRAGLEETQAVDFKDEVGQVQVEFLEFAKEQGENESSVPTAEGLADQVPQEIIERGRVVGATSIRRSTA